MCQSYEEGLFCGHCGTELKPIGKEIVREELEYIPAKLTIIRYIRMAYECPACKHTDNPYIMKAEIPASLYRQEKEWEILGIGLTRAKMAN